MQQNEINVATYATLDDLLSLRNEAHDQSMRISGCIDTISEVESKVDRIEYACDVNQSISSYIQDMMEKYWQLLSLLYEQCGIHIVDNIGSMRTVEEIRQELVVRNPKITFDSFAGF